MVKSIGYIKYLYTPFKDVIVVDELMTTINTSQDHSRNLYLRS